jgi:hypothetical protein
MFSSPREASRFLLFNQAKNDYQHFQDQQEKTMNFYHHQDLFFGVFFLVIGLFTLYRVRQAQQMNAKSRKVITLFNSCICFTSFIHAIWFLIPDRYLYKYYLDNGIDCQESNFHNLFLNYWKNHNDIPLNTIFKGFIHPNPDKYSSPDQQRDQSQYYLWQGKFLSEVLIALGNLSFYSLFIIISCYWYFMHKKAEENQELSFQQSHLFSYQNPTGTAITDSTNRNNPISSSSSSMEKRKFRFLCIALSFNSMELFFFIFFWLFLCQSILLTVFWMEGINSQQLFLCNCLFYILVGVGIFWGMNDLSEKVLVLLENLPIQQGKSQIGRIYGITMLANLFCLTHIVLDGLMATYLIYGFIGKKRRIY